MLKRIVDAVERLDRVICASEECLKENLLEDLRAALAVLSELESIQEAPDAPEDPAPVIRATKVLKPVPGRTFLLSGSLLGEALKGDVSWFDRVPQIYVDNFEGVRTTREATADLLMVPTQVAEDVRHARELLGGLFDGRGHLAYFHGQSLLWACLIELIEDEGVYAKGNYIFVDRPKWRFKAPLDRRATRRDTFGEVLDPFVCSNIPLLCRYNDCARTAKPILCPDEIQVTCPRCREELGLPPIKMRI